MHEPCEPIVVAVVVVAEQEQEGAPEIEEAMLVRLMMMRMHFYNSK